MGMDEIEHNKRDARAAKKHAKKAQFVPRGSKGAGTADWEAVALGTLAHAIATVAKHGGALRLGYTRDGGAYAIGVYGDGEPHTVYVSPNDDVEGVLDELADWFEHGSQGAE